MITKELHISASQVRQYSTCPLQWAYSRTLKPDFISSALVFGRAFHKAAQYYSQARLCGRTPTLESLLCVFGHEVEQETAEVRYKNGESQLTMVEEAEKTLTCLIDNAPQGEVLAVEQAFNCRVCKDIPTIAGVIDLLESDEGTPVLVDWKTSARKPSNPSTDQLVLYGIISERIGLVEAGKYELEYRYITRTKTPQYIPIRFKPDRKTQHRVIERMKRCWRGMRSNVVYPNPGWMCAGCGYKTYCDHWPEKGHAAVLCKSA